MNPCSASFNIGKRCLSCRLLNSEYFSSGALYRCLLWLQRNSSSPDRKYDRSRSRSPSELSHDAKRHKKEDKVSARHSSLTMRRRLEFNSCSRVYESIYRPVWSCILYSVHLLSVRIGGMWRCVYCRQDGENSDTDLVVDDENQVCTLVDGQNVYINVLACLIVLSCWKCETRTCTSTSFVRIKDMWWRLLAAVDTTKWRATREWTRQD